MLLDLVEMAWSLGAVSSTAMRGDSCFGLLIVFGSSPDAGPVEGGDCFVPFASFVPSSPGLTTDSSSSVMLI